MAAPHVYRPRMGARIFVPAAGEPSTRKLQEQNDQVYELRCRPTRGRWVSNNHNEADELDLTLLHDEAGLDPRVLRSAEVYFYLDNADAAGQFTMSYSNLRFVGIVRDCSRKFAESGGKIVTIRALDYTTLFLEMHNFPDAGIPDFTQTITEAWNRICDHTGYWDLDTREIVSSVENLKSDGTGGPSDKLVFLGVDRTITLGSAVPDRIARLGKLQLHNAGDAWAVWQFAVGSLGLISYVRGDRVIVTTATDFYTADDPPRMIWGPNVYELEESRDLGNLSAKNVCVRSYDPLAGKTLESLYPSASLALRKKKIGASAAKKAPKTMHTQDYECLDLPFPVADQAVLDTIARRVWEERTRQELRGHLKTRAMIVDTVGKKDFELLKLQAGDQIQVEVEREALGRIQQLATTGQRMQAMLDLGYSQDMATFVVNNLDALTRLPPQFLVQSVATELDTTSDPGSYDVQIDFINRINISGAATGQGSGSNEAPMMDQET